MPQNHPARLYTSLALALFGLLFFFSLVRAGDMVFIYLPIVEKQPTPTRTPTATPQTGSPQSLTGQLALCNPGKTVYGLSEAVCVVETLDNPTNTIINHGIIGVEAVRVATNEVRFQTSWSGNPLIIDPLCTGPTDRCGGPWQDNLRGFDDTPGFKVPGQYRLKLALCYPTANACLSGQGIWRLLTPGLTIMVQ